MVFRFATMLEDTRQNKESVDKIQDVFFLCVEAFICAGHIGRCENDMWSCWELKKGDINHGKFPRILFSHSPHTKNKYVFPNHLMHL